MSKKQKVNPNSERIAYGIVEAAELVSLSERTVRRAIFNPDPAKRLRSVKLNGRRLVRDEDLRDWFNRIAYNENEAA